MGKKNLQDKILNELRKDNISVTFYLINGFQLNGLVVAFDNFTILVNSDGKDQLIYKHAISTLVPEKRINLFDGGDTEKEKGEESSRNNEED